MRADCCSSARLSLCVRRLMRWSFTARYTPGGMVVRSVSISTRSPKKSGSSTSRLDSGWRYVGIVTLRVALAFQSGETHLNCCLVSSYISLLRVALFWGGRDIYRGKELGGLILVLYPHDVSLSL